MQCSPESRGSCAVLAYRGHLLTENRNGLVGFDTHHSSVRSAERDAALLMAEGLPGETGHPFRAPIILNRGAGRILGTASPGESENIGIAGHRDGFIRGLKDVQVGDRIALGAQGGEFLYSGPTNFPLTHSIDGALVFITVVPSKACRTIPSDYDSCILG